MTNDKVTEAIRSALDMALHNFQKTDDTRAFLNEATNGVVQAMQSASPRVGTGFNTQDQAEAAAMHSASPRPTGDVEAVVRAMHGELLAMEREDGTGDGCEFDEMSKEQLAMLTRIATAALAALQPADPVEPKVSGDEEELARSLCDDLNARIIAEQESAPVYDESAPDVQEYWRCLALAATLRATDPSRELVEEAYHEALKRYPDASGALVFFYGASGLAWREPTAEELEWARKRIEARAALALGQSDTKGEGHE